MAHRENASNIEATESQLEKYYSLVLAFFYYWVNAGPLTRGSAATGYAALFALLQAAGRRLGGPLPTGKQLDWEAILQPDPAAFVSVVKGWLFRGIVASDLLGAGGGGEIGEVFGTLRAALEGLNFV